MAEPKSKKKKAKEPARDLSLGASSDFAFDYKIRDHETEPATKTEDNYFKELQEILEALDNKDRTYYRRLSEERQKRVPFYLLLRYMSVVTGDSSKAWVKKENYSNNPLLESYYIQSTNAAANKHFFDTKLDGSDEDQTELKWLMLTAASPGMGTWKHPWIAKMPESLLKKELADAEKRKDKKRVEKLSVLARQYPTAKEDEILLLAEITTDDEIRDYLRRCGQES